MYIMFSENIGWNFGFSYENYTKCQSCQNLDYNNPNKRTKISIENHWTLSLAGHAA